MKSKSLQASSSAVESMSEQVNAVQKVVGGMTGREVSSEDMRRVVKDVQKNPDSRAVVQKILGSGAPPVEKYSPVTGKHYSGELEFAPETGEKLEPVEE